MFEVRLGGIARLDKKVQQEIEKHLIRRRTYRWVKIEGREELCKECWVEREEWVGVLHSQIVLHHHLVYLSPSLFPRVESAALRVDFLLHSCCLSLLSLLFLIGYRHSKSSWGVCSVRHSLYSLQLDCEESQDTFWLCDVDGSRSRRRRERERGGRWRRGWWW